MNPTHLTLLACAAMVLPIQAETNSPPSPSGTYYSAQRPWLPPLPFHPFPELPAMEVEPKRFIYDDTLVNYDLLQSASLTSGPPVPGGGGSSGTNPPPPYVAPTVPIPGVPLLQIELFPLMPTGNRVKLISFNTKTNFYYTVEATTNLSNPVWNVTDEFVATGTNTSFAADDEAGMQFYRVRQASDLFTFPDWFDRIEQYMEFKVKTSVTSGTFTWELFADEVSVGNNTLAIPSDRTLTVYDPNYNPNDWPNTGLYNVGAWRLRVGVTPTPPHGMAASQTTFVDVRKKGKQRNPRGTYQAALGHVYGIFSTSATVQDDVDNDLLFYASAIFNACELVTMDGTQFWEPIDATQIRANCAMSAARWTNLFKMVGHGPEDRPTWIDYFHFLGHGDPSGISGGGGHLTEKMLLNSALKTNGMTYVALDACSAGDGKHFLKAWTGYDKTVPIRTFKIWGRDPAFGCGWDRAKGVEFVTKLTRIDEHFWFWDDWYHDLTRRNQFGLMYRRYKDAYDFARAPGETPFHRSIANNPHAAGFVMVGCDECRFDERPAQNGY